MKKTFGIRYKGNGTYYEKHHIIPHSLGGSDLDKNLVLLTAREHYLCHWLLVKRNEMDSVDRKKMLKAWFMMVSSGNNQRPKLQSMRDYAKYRNEMSSIMHESQIGKKNSQFGKHWYTNRDTGESNSFLIAPNEKWILGRNLFHGESKTIKFKKTKSKQKNKQINRTNYIEVYIKSKNKIIKRIKEQHENILMKSQKLWDEYHNGEYKSLRDFSKSLNMSVVAVRNRFINYIPIYEKMIIPGKCFPSNKDLIGKYE